LQFCLRPLRPHPSKPFANIILCGTIDETGRRTTDRNMKQLIQYDQGFADRVRRNPRTAISVTHFKTDEKNPESQIEMDEDSEEAQLLSDEVYDRMGRLLNNKGEYHPVLNRLLENLDANDGKKPKEKDDLEMYNFMTKMIAGKQNKAEHEIAMKNNHYRRLFKEHKEKEKIDKAALLLAFHTENGRWPTQSEKIIGMYFDHILTGNTKPPAVLEDYEPFVKERARRKLVNRLDPAVAREKTNILKRWIEETKAPPKQKQTTKFGDDDNWKIGFYWHSMKNKPKKLVEERQWLKANCPLAKQFLEK
jgi:hypothetical protein